MTEPLPLLLDHYYHDTLLQIAESNYLPSVDDAGHKLRKDILIKMLCERLYIPERARASLAHLNPTQHIVLDRILLHGGEVETVILQDELEREGIVETVTAKGGHGSSFEEVSTNLILRGLVLSEGQPQTWNPTAKLDLNPGLRLVVPDPVRKGLPKPALPSVEWGAGTLPAPPVETNVSLAQRDLFIYWSHVRTQPIPLTQAGLVQKRTLRALNEQLLFPDTALGTALNEEQAPRLHFLRLLLQDLQMLVPERTRSRRNGTENGRSQLVSARQNGPVPEFWDKDIEERTNACLQVWMQMTDWSELSSLGMSTFDLDLQRGRGMLLEQLRLLEPGVWLSADRFLSRLTITVANLLFQYRYRGMAYQSLAVSPAPRDRAWGHDSTSPLNGGRRFAEIESTFVGCALSGPLHWLGVVDVSADGGRLLAFRINHSGAAVLGIRSPQPSLPETTSPPTAVAPVGPRAERPAEGGARLIVQPNFQVFALGPISEATLARLELFADRVKADRSAFEYTLSRATIYRGQKAGVSTEQIIHFLEQAADTALPQNVLRTLHDWGEQHERIVFHRTVALCEGAEPEVLNELWADPGIQPYLQQSLTPTVALLKKGRVPAFREALLRHGSLPTVSTRADRCTGRLQATPDGELLPVHAGPDLLLDWWLRRLAEPRTTPPILPKTQDGVAEAQGAPREGEERFYITEAAVRRALGTGLSLKEYLEQLDALYHGPVPAELQMRIKAWGRYYGKALLQQAVLLEVKDSATADELMADPELAPLLSRFAADPRGRLLLVHTRDLQRLHHLLEERGVEVMQQP